MRFLVTGGAGFIGSHLCEALLKQGHEVVCLDNFVTGSEANVAGLKKMDRFKLVIQDVRQPIDLTADFIFHLASPASPVDYVRMPIETLTTNAFGVHNVLESARRHKTPVFLASTSEVYGDPLVSPQSESYWGNVNPVGERSCYDEGKRFAEALAFSYRHEHGLPVFIGRIFNTFGPRMRANDGRAIPNFINQAIADQPLTVSGDGTQTRSFCYIDDLIRALIKIPDLPLDELLVVNLGNDEEMTILELAKQVRAKCGSEAPIVFKRPLGDDPMQRRPDLTKAKRLLDWKPTVSLDEGLAIIIDWFTRERAHALSP